MDDLSLPPPRIHYGVESVGRCACGRYARIVEHRGTPAGAEYLVNCSRCGKRWVIQ